MNGLVPFVVAGLGMFYDLRMRYNRNTDDLTLSPEHQGKNTASTRLIIYSPTPYVMPIHSSWANIRQIWPYHQAFIMILITYDAKNDRNRHAPVFCPLRGVYLLNTRRMYTWRTHIRFFQMNSLVSLFPYHFSKVYPKPLLPTF